jgi:hypothetical protein
VIRVDGATVLKYTRRLNNRTEEDDGSDNEVMEVVHIPGRTIPCIHVRHIRRLIRMPVGKPRCRAKEDVQEKPDLDRMVNHRGLRAAKARVAFKPSDHLDSRRYFGELLRGDFDALQ